jgi:hypothetical protein
VATGEQNVKMHQWSACSQTNPPRAPPGPSPVLQLLAADAHGPLVALGNAHLVAAALHLLAGVLSGVQGFGNTSQDTDHLGRPRSPLPPAVLDDQSS